MGKLIRAVLRGRNGGNTILLPDIIDHARSYNKLATSIRRPLDQPETVVQPDARNVGFWLNNFTNEELSQVFPKYQQVFSLHGPLQGTVREACQHPLVLRLLAEAWSKRDEPLPQEISQLELFEAYWKMKVSEVQRRLEAERWLCEVAKICVELGKRQVGLDELRARLPSLDHQDETYQDLVRSGLLQVTTDKYGHTTISFGLDTLRTYVYALKVQAWPKKIEDGKSREVAVLMCNLLEHTVGLEVVEFYIRTIDRGETRLLTDIALQDIFKFVQLLDIISARSFVFAATTGDEQRQAFIVYLTQFVIAYSDLLHRYFPDLCERVEPYKRGEVGLWISGSPNSTMYQFRERTPLNPEPLIIVSPEVATLLSNKQASPELYDRIRPGGRVHLDLRGLGLVEHLPQKTAWNYALSQIGGLVAKRALDESITPSTLQERIRQILTEEPAMHCEGVPVTGVFQQTLGFQTPEAIEAIPIEEVISRTQALIEQYLASLSA